MMMMMTNTICAKQKCYEERLGYRYQLQDNADAARRLCSKSLTKTRG